MVTQLTFRLKYGVGKQHIRVAARNFLEVLEPRLPAAPAEAPEELVGAALNKSGWFARRKRVKVAVVVPDITRNCAANILMPVILDKLSGAGVALSNVTVVFANGLHRKHTEVEQRRIVGDDVFGRVTCVDHDPDASDVVKIGTLADGTPVEVNRSVAEADGVVVTGSISVHYLAGFGGGGKCIAPGVASRRTIVGLHRLTLCSEPGKGRHHCVQPGVIAGNPFRAAIDAAAQLLPDVLLVNTIMAPDGRLLRVVTGSLSEAFAEGVSAFSQIYVRRCREYANLVVVSSGGFPHDMNFIQAHKAMVHAANVLEDGGVMLLLARCQDGLGSPEMAKWFQYRNLQEMEAALRKNFEVYGQTAYATREKAQRFKIILLSELPKSVVEAMGIVPISSLHEVNGVIEDFVTRYPKVYVIPHGSAVLPVIG